MKKRLTMFLACMLLSLGAALAQNKITGTVFEDNGEPCIGATVMIQGSKQGTKTDLDGHFTINVPYVGARCPDTDRGCSRWYDEAG